MSFHRPVVRFFTGKQSLVFGLSLALFWSIELFVIQYMTLGSLGELAAKNYYISVGLRFFFDLLLCCGIVFSFSRVFVVCLFFLSFVYGVVVLEYFDYFGHALSFNTIKEQARDFYDVVSAETAWFDFRVASVLFVLLVVKCIFFQKYIHKVLSGWSVRVFGVSILFGYIATVLVCATFFDKMEKFKWFCSFDRMAVTYGYLPAWIGESIYFDQELLVKEAVGLRDHSLNRISHIEELVSLPDHVVILQVESLDYDILGFEYKGKEITPNINKILDKSMFFKVEAIHDNGSADADFVLHNGVRPSPRVVTFKLKDYPYQNPTSLLAENAGYNFRVWHNFSGKLFNRRFAYNKMGSMECCFMEELQDRYALSQSIFGISDRDFFKILQSEIPGSSGRNVDFIITLTSHIPFNFLPSKEYRLIENPSGMHENYLNSIHYTDNVLGDFFSSLKDGTLVFIYGDHESSLSRVYRNRPQEPRTEYVPFVVYQKGRDISLQQKSRGTELALSGELTFLDAANYIRNSIVAAGNGG